MAGRLGSNNPFIVYCEFKGRETGCSNRSFTYTNIVCSSTSLHSNVPYWHPRALPSTRTLACSLGDEGYSPRPSLRTRSTSTFTASHCSRRQLCECLTVRTSLPVSAVENLIQLSAPSSAQSTCGGIPAHRRSHNAKTGGWAGKAVSRAHRQRQEEAETETETETERKELWGIAEGRETAREQAAWAGRGSTRQGFTELSCCRTR
eukprot:54297-Hanusia_phi.AAC.2